jgi:hypothetical protein
VVAAGLVVFYKSQQTMPEAARAICACSPILIQYAREHAVELTQIKKQTFAGRTEIKFSSFNNYCLEMAPYTTRTLTAAFAKFQIENGIEDLVDFRRILASSYQAV